jgi:hypothetical protein
MTTNSDGDLARHGDMAMGEAAAHRICPPLPTHARRYPRPGCSCAGTAMEIGCAQLGCRDDAEREMQRDMAIARMAAAGSVATALVLAMWAAGWLPPFTQAVAGGALAVAGLLLLLASIWLAW